MLGSIIVGGAVAAWIIVFEAGAPDKKDMDRIAQLLRRVPDPFPFPMSVMRGIAALCAVCAIALGGGMVLGSVAGMADIGEEVDALDRLEVEAARSHAVASEMEERLRRVGREICVLRHSEAECARVMRQD